MNNGIYRLVFNKSRGLWMAVSEHVRSHQSGKSNGGKSKAKRNKRAAETASLFVILFGLGASSIVSIAFAAPRLPANTIPTNLQAVKGNITIHTPEVNPANANGQLLRIDQSSLKGIMNGTNFNIGSSSAVNFNHTGGTGSATLIRISGPKSIIEGALNSPKGAIYLINQNGILFGNGARVDVNGLVASTLNIADDDFMSTLGHLNAYADGGRAAYIWEGDAAGYENALIEVEPDAHIKAALGGSVMLFGSKVINQGSIETTEGQVAMAAGNKVYLSVAPDLNGGNSLGVYNYTQDSPYRGLAGVLVEVDSPDYIVDQKDVNGNVVTDVNGDPVKVKLTGEVINDTMGRILAQRGNVTMASFLVNQNGRVTATSSATQKGSIRLLARDTIAGGSATIEPNSTEAPLDFATRLVQNGTPTQTENTIITGSRTGKLGIGANSITTVLAEDSAALAKANEIFATPQAGVPAVKAGEKSYVETVINAVNVKGTTLTDEQVFNAPTIEAVGRQVTIGDNAKIVAPSGFINISAQKSGLGLNADGTNSKDAESRLFLGKNTLIDVAGLKNVAVDMERNFVEVLLTLTDLKDDPINRDGFLYREKVWFDIRDTPDSHVADLAGFVKQVPRSLGEKLAVAGEVSLKSEGDLIQSSGSIIDVSGGSLKFNTGINKESWVVAQNGKAYALGDAPVDTLFTQFLGGTNTRRLQEAGYTEGKAAGKVSIDAYDMALDGQISGGATYGEHQRESKNLGGTLAINVMKPDGLVAGHDVNIGNTTPLASNFTATDVLPTARAETVEINANMLSNSGFENIAISTTENVTVNSALKIADGGKLSLSGRDVKVNKNIVARGGSIALKSAFTAGSVASDDTNIKVADGVTLDVSGNWVNDKLSRTATGRVITDGGKVTISSGDEVKLGSGSLVDVSGGGWLQSDGDLVNGDAGSIAIASQVGQGAQDNPYTYVAPELNGELRGFALGTGGELSITAPFITVGNTGFSDARDFLATPEFFQKSGFTQFNLTGRDGVLVKSNTNVDVIAKNYVLNRGFQQQVTGGHVHDFATKTILPDYMRSSTSLALSTLATNNELPGDAFSASGVARGSIVVETGASLKVDANGLRTNTDGKKVPPSIALSAWDNQIFIDGTLQAPAGDISLTMNGDATLTDDPGYNAAQAIWLGANAKLLAAGYARNTPTGSRLSAGDVYDGGNITIDAKKGYVVAETGSVMDVSGSSAIFDVKNTNRYTPTKVASNGGDVSISAREGMLLDSTFKASSPGALGGSLEVRLTRGGSRTIGLPSALYPGTAPSAENGFNQDLLIDQNQLWYVDLSQSGTFVPASFDVGDSIRSVAGGLAKISANSIMSAGFSDVALKSEHGVRFTGDVDLTVSRSLSLNAKVVEATDGSTVRLTAPNVVIANDIDAKPLRDPVEFTAATPVAGTAKLIVNANLLNLNGQFALSHFATTTLNSTGDIRMTGVSDPNVAPGDLNQPPVGQLVTTGELNFNARQIYPTSLSDFTVTVNGAGSKVSFNKINPNGGYDKVLSAGGKLTVNAETIDQNGVLLAPFGTIALNASDTLNLNSGSVTSVSAQGALIPFGNTDRDGLDYLYDFGPNSQQFTAPPERVVKLNAPNVNQNDGSTVDISGGGDLFAYEWVPGIGGSSDVLAGNANQNAFGKGTTDTWAIMPANNQTFASFDTQYWQGSDVKAGDAVYISGVAGLAAGYYTLLPARYALLPGAMLVSSVTGYQDRTGGSSQVLANGSTLVSGHLAAYTANGYTQTSRTAGFVVRPGTDAYKLAQYNTTKASTYFKANSQAQQTADAGRLSIAATNSLVLKGILNAVPGQGGLGAEVDIAAPKLLVVADGEQTGQVTKDGVTYLAIDEQTLVNFNAASLLLGGTRSNGKLDVIASDVRMSENSNLVGPEVILAATDTVLLDSGAHITGSGAGATAKDLTIGAVGGADGDGALVRVSGGKATTVTRLNVNGDRGELTVESGATVEGDGSILLDASKKMDIAGDIEFADGAALGFSSSHVSLGAPDNNEAVTDGLWLKKTQLDQFVDAGSLFLQSQSTIDLYGDASFGNNNFDLTLQSAGIAGYQNAGKTTTITTRNITLANNDNATFAPAAPLGAGTTPVLGSGTLAINAETVTNGNNTVRLAGFDQVNVTASKELVVQGNTAREVDQPTSNKLVVDKNLTINTPRITASNNADYAIEATNGLLKIQSNAATQSTLAEATSQGTQLKLSGVQVLLANGATVDMRGGKTSLEATGLNATDHVTLESGARILAQGSAYTLNDQTFALPAGQVSLTSKHGDVDVQLGALVDLTAAGNGDAGKLIVSAVNGEAKLAGEIKAAAAGAKGKNAAAIVDVKVISDISRTIAALSTFSGAQSYRLREGDVTIAATDSITAHDVKVVADSGAITINGKMDASGDKGGSIEVFAKNDVTVNAGAELLAKGTADTTSTAGSLGNGGDVLLSSDIGIVSTATPDANGLGGALIDVSGDQVGTVKGEGGEVIFRAARTGSGAGNGVNVDSKAAGAVTGAKRVLVEAVKKYNYSSIGTSEQATIKTDTNTFATDVAGLMAGYNNTRDGVAALIAPGVEVSSVGDLTVSANWILGSSSSTPAQLIPSGGILTLRAGNNLILDGNIDYEQFNAGNILTQRLGSWSYRLVAGADASSVNPEAVTHDVGDIRLSDAKFVRTGTGFIHAVAGNDIQLGTENGAGAAIYTEGLPEPVVVQGQMSTPADFKLLVTNFTVNRELYADGGGDVSLNAGGDVFGSLSKAETQDVKSWLYHAARSTNTINPQVRWWSRYDKFTNGVATFGGGDIHIVAGGDLSNMQVAAATNGRMGGDVNAAPDLANFSELGGGDISIETGGSMNQVLLHTGKGKVEAKVGADMNVALSLMKSKVDLIATGALSISSASNPTIGDSASGASNRIKFYTYDEETSVNAVSLAGDVSVKGDDRVFPSKLFVAAAEGDVNIENVVLYPSATGNATVLAGNDVVINSLIMSEVNPDSLPIITTPNLKSAVNTNISVLSNYSDTSGHTDGLLHSDDTEPVRVYAENDITFKVQNPLVTPKRVEIKAGHDVVDPNVIAQNIKATDVSVISAGNAIRYNEPVRNGDSINATEAGIQIAGPGRLHLIADGDIDLGTSDGVRSVGNLYNAYLPEQGADILAHAGAAAVADYNGILNAYVESSSQYSSIYLPQLTAYMRERTDDDSLSSSQALADFKLLNRQSQTAFINQVFFAELQASGRETIKVGSADYSRSERAILRMFPTFTTNQNLVSQTGSLMQGFGNIANENVTHPGDLNLFYSQIRSERGGRIEILVPGGLVNAGLAVAGNLKKPDTNLGIVSLRGGELLAMVRNDFQVNQSRVFTLGGSDLMLYSALADIDAGKGSKTSSSTPPPVIRIVDGKVTYDYSGAVSGSGIAALTATGGEPGDVDLFAPYGEINAGEAGIRSAGNINLGALRVVGADNITAGGGITGAPVASVAGISFTAPLPNDVAGASKQGDQLADAASQSSDRKLVSLPSLISVEVVSLGDESSPAASLANPPASDDKNKLKNKENP
ncbi:MAG: filamentous hemagglutinin family protein [Methylotenera sp.]